MIMRSLSLAILGLVAACAVSGAGPATGPATGPAPTGHPLEGRIFWLAGGAAEEAAEEIDEDELARRLGEADLAILGEVHDNPAHHRRQARLVAALAPGGLAFEMVPEASEEGIAVFRAQGGAPGEIGPAIGWERLGWPDWALYRPIFEAAPEAYIAGGGVGSADLRRAMSEGALSGFGTGAVYYGLALPLPVAEREAIEEEMVAAHCGALPREAAAPMVEAQRLRDARFAHAARRALAAGGGRAVLITGNGHARTDRGVPVYLAAGSTEIAVLSLGQVEVDPEAEALGDYGALPYDAVWFSPPAERGDPCAAFVR